MENSTIGWILLLLAFFISTFGLFWCFCMILSFIFFVFGFLSTLYVCRGTDNVSDVCSEDPLTGETPVIEGGLKKVIDLLQARRKPPKTDRRITGSELIDSSLQEILGYIIRDYILPWYNLLSVDDEFPEVTVRSTAQNLAINISNRVKEIDWIPYLTTRLVDDAASHLRLYKQARNKLEQSTKLKSQGSSPARDQKLTTPNYSLHRRNKSEADMTKYGKNKDPGRGNVGNSKFYLPDQSKNTLEDYFFELECQMENNVICRDAVCVDANEEKEFLSDLVELLLYMLLPDEDFACKPLRFILREILSNCVIVPLFTNMSDPDFINQTMVWLCIRENLPSDIFLLTLRLTDNCDELIYTKELVTKEMQLLRSRDSGGDGDLFIKQQLSSLSYLTKLIDSRLSKLENTKGSESTTIDYAKLETIKNIKLPLDVILKNNVALSYFIDFATIGGFQAYVFFYLNIEGWKVSTEQQLSALHINKMKNLSDNASGVYETIRSAALSLFDQYLGEKSQHKVQVKPSLVQTLYFKIRNINESPTEQWFNNIQEHIYDKLQTQHEFLPAFRESKAYLKLLEELDLVQQTVDEDTISLNSNESGEINLEQAKTSSQRNVNFLTVENSKLPKHVRSLSDITDMGAKDDKISNSQGKNSSQVPKESFSAPKEEKKENLKVGDFNLTVVIIETGIVCEKGKTFGVYALQVTRQFDTGFLEEWHVYRRYSDFYDLHTKIKDKFPDLSKLPFPGKKTFHNMDRSVLEKRMKMLGSYLQQICQRHVLSSHPALSKLLMVFLEQGEYDRATSGGPISHTIDTIVNPLKSGMKTIKNMPEQLINTVDEVVEGISKVFTSKGSKLPEASKVGAALDHESDDNIPLRIMLLLMDEVFDLKSRNQWLRRRMVTLLRQILRAMFGDIVNRRILDYVSYITSPQNVAHYLHTFKQSFWPNGVKAEKGVERDKATRFRTRVAAKVALLMWSTDDLKHIIGSETMRRGLLTIFELFQRPILNRRLLYVLLEGVLTHLFPDKDMPKFFQKLHSKKKCDYSNAR